MSALPVPVCVAARRAVRVGVAGPVGAGKTALLERFLASAGEPAPTVLRGSGEEGESLLAYGVVCQLARSAGPAGAALLACPLALLLAPRLRAS